MIVMDSRPAAVTGGCGFIGSHLVRSLVGRCELTVIDDLSGGDVRRISGLPVRLVRRCVTSDLTDILRGVDVVFHLAARVSLPESLRDPAQDARINVLGTVSVLEAARRAGVRRVVLASSSAVYADCPVPCAETMVPVPVTPYGAAKVSAEAYAVAFSSLGLETVRLRLFNVYGPGQDAADPNAGVVTLFCDRVRTGRPITLYGDGDQTRDFTHVDDVVAAFHLAAVIDGAAGGVFNVGTGVPTPIAELASLFGPVQVEAHPERTGDVRDNFACVRCARDVLGFRARIGLPAGVLGLGAASEAAAAREEER